MDLFELALKLTTEGEGEVKASLHGIASVAEELKSSLMELASMLGLGLGLEKVVEASVEAQYSLAQLNAAVKSTGGVAGQSVDGLVRMGEEMQKLTIYSHDTVESASAILLTFEHIRGEAFERTITVAADLGARLGTDLPQATRLLGRALEDPERGMMALRRAGIVFTQSNKETIKTLQEAGDIEGAQAFMLGELEKRFGGAAEAAKNTLGGALAGLKNQFTDLLEYQGKDTTALVEFIKTLTRFAEVLKENKDLLEGVLVALGTVGFLSLVPKVVSGILAIDAAITAAAASGVLLSLSFAPLSAAIIAAAVVFGIYKKMVVDVNEEERLLDEHQQDRIRSTVARQGERAKKAREEHDAAEKAIEQAKRNADAEEQQFALRLKLIPLTAQTAMQFDLLGKEADKYAAAAAKANISDTERLRLLEREKSLRDAVGKAGGTTQTIKGQKITGDFSDFYGDTLEKLHKEMQDKNTKWQTAGDGDAVASILGTPEQQKKDTEKWLKGLEQTVTESLKNLKIKIPLALALGAQFNDAVKEALKQMHDSVGPALSAGFAALFSGKGIGGAFKAMGKQLLAGLGSIVTALGEKVLAMAIPMAAIQKAFSSMNPYLMAAAGVALIALGSAMSAAGGSAASGMGGGSVSASSGFVGSPITFGPTTQSVAPSGNAASGTANMSVQPTLNFTVIGTRDPQAQRQIVELIDNAKRR